MVSALVQVGIGKLRPDDVRRILEAKDRTQAPPTAPPDGLFLEQVEYTPEALLGQFPPRSPPLDQ